MKQPGKSIIVGIILLGMILVTNCNQPTLARLSNDNILGADAKAELLQASKRIDGVKFAPLGVNSSGAEASSALLNGVLIPILAEINPDKYYKRDGVEACVKNIYILGLALPNYASVELSCKIEEVTTFDFLK
ncbi:TIGR04452 family lipoprotein [Leptospira levettii]|uniref:TIGR04452 family lipoprotein n=1 Tax=Leptospira levettii TaxID=2023178 RepID=A0A5F2DCK7_9LEPT|nr:TIGR04452 family lipoprotein [Leptospira levettii]PKA28072.1 lipoprotein [Leptospira sp. mixed culture ATI2-C-A1]MCW7467222.1 TIGR04452 family lipoprotein [Leptospira levettii]MCW7497905.1 TIGR04452 family lipoprotein [Leptospira levettii]MCW7512944.1 TIGR04452 family lipoprotein [Leptospira levettii]MCW7516922.1 TIGR04452 family lipoprotein [Leptospira levettii]